MTGFGTAAAACIVVPDGQGSKEVGVAGSPAIVHAGTGRARVATWLVAVTLFAGALSACSSRAGQAVGHQSASGAVISTIATSPVGPPSDSPLTSCVSSHPAAVRPIDSPLARRFAFDRVQSAWSLDGGRLVAAPAPADAAPNVDAALAYCNLLAATTANGYPITGAARQHGLSFGLAVVTIADALYATGNGQAYADGDLSPVTLQPFHRRLAWIALVEPDLYSLCPRMVSGRSKTTGPAIPPLPSFQVLLIDAATGTAGVIYAAWTNSPCFGTPEGPSISGLSEQVSVPWTFGKQLSDPREAQITYYPRPCDARPLSEYDVDQQRAVFLDRDHPNLVRVVLARVVTSCGPASPTAIHLVSATRAEPLPSHLVHAPVGAQDA